jgi:hypothetical protein
MRVSRRFWILVFVAVCGTWAFCFLITLRAVWTNPPGSIATYGQFGDVFGAVNALFTGVALVGLVYTAIVQREQSNSQFEQLELQRKDSGRQAREQFLTARLNAQAALAQTRATAHDLAVRNGYCDAARQEFEMIELHRFILRLQILWLEALQGFDSGAWSPSVEKEALRVYFVGLIGTLAERSARWDENQREEVAILLDSVCHELDLFDETFFGQYPEISRIARTACQMLKPGVADPSQRSGALAWCESVHDLCKPGVSPWV